MNWLPEEPISRLGSVDELAMIVNAGLNVEGYASLEHTDHTPFMAYLSRSLNQGSASGLRSSLSSIAVGSLRAEVLKGVAAAERQLTSTSAGAERKFGTFAPFRQAGVQEINVGDAARVRLVFEEMGGKGNFPRKVEVWFFSDAACTQCIRRVGFGNTADLVLDCSRLYFMAYGSNSTPIGPQFPLPKHVSTSYMFTCYSSTSGGGEGSGVLASSMQTTLQLVDALLEAGEATTATDTATPSEHDVPLLIELLQALPYVGSAKMAAMACRTATRLTQQWARSVVMTGGCDPGVMSVIQDIYYRMERAHSWLRTVGVSSWSGNSILPTHVQV